MHSGRATQLEIIVANKNLICFFFRTFQSQPWYRLTLSEIWKNFSKTMISYDIFTLGIFPLQTKSKYIIINSCPFDSKTKLKQKLQPVKLHYKVEFSMLSREHSLHSFWKWNVNPLEIIYRFYGFTIAVPVTKRAQT